MPDIFDQVSAASEGDVFDRVGNQRDAGTPPVAPVRRIAGRVYRTPLEGLNAILSGYAPASVKVEEDALAPHPFLRDLPDYEAENNLPSQLLATAGNVALEIDKIGSARANSAFGGVGGAISVAGRAIPKILPFARKGLAVLSGGFAGTMAPGAVEAISRAKTVYDDPNATKIEKTQAIADAAMASGMTTLAVLGAIHEALPAKPKPRGSGEPPVFNWESGEAARTAVAVEKLKAERAAEAGMKPLAKTDAEFSAEAKKAKLPLALPDKPAGAPDAIGTPGQPIEEITTVPAKKAASLPLAEAEKTGTKIAGEITDEAAFEAGRRGATDAEVAAARKAAAAEAERNAKRMADELADEAAFEAGRVKPRGPLAEPIKPAKAPPDFLAKQPGAPGPLGEPGQPIEEVAPAKPLAEAPAATPPPPVAKSATVATEAKPTTAVSGSGSVDVPLSDITLSTDVPQFKSGANKSGIVKPLGGKFDPTGVGPVQLWRRLDGRLELISGRHRFDLAQRSGDKAISAQIHDEASGFDKRAAARLDAELNIKDEQGSVADYANYFKNSAISEADAQARGLLARGKGRAGFDIARDASEDLFALHQSGRLTDAQAEAIVNSARGDVGLQQVGIDTALKGGNAERVADIVALAKQRVSERKAVADQGDLFAFDDSAIREMEAQSDLARKERGTIREQIMAVKGAAKKPEVASKMGVDAKNPKSILKKVTELEARLELLKAHPEEAGRLAAETPAKAGPLSAAPANVAEGSSLKTQADTSHSGKSPQELLDVAAPYEQFGPNYDRNIATSAGRLRQDIERKSKFAQLAADELAVRLDLYAGKGAAPEVAPPKLPLADLPTNVIPLDEIPFNLSSEEVKAPKSALEIAADRAAAKAEADKQGDLFAEPPKDGPLAEKPVAPKPGPLAGAEAPKLDIIDRLKAMKRTGRGKVYSAPEALFDAAHDAAIDVAIAAITVGRTVAHAYRLAVEHFKAQFPDHTPEHLSAVEATLREATGFEGRARGPLSSSSPTGIKNVSVDQQRAAVGLPPKPPREGAKVLDTQAEAERRIRQDPLAGQKLVNSIVENEHGIDAVENMVLQSEVRKLRNERASAERQLDDAIKSGDETAIVSARDLVDDVQAKYDKAFDATFVAGTKWSDTGRMRQQMLNEDFSIAELERRQSRANEGGPITDEQRARIKQDHADYERTLAESEKKRIAAEEGRASAELDLALERMLKNVGKVTKKAPSENAVLKFVIDQGDAAEARLLARMKQGPLFSGLDPAMMLDFVVYGAGRIGHGAAKFANWSAHMVEKFGEGIRPHLETIFKKAQESLESSKRYAPELPKEKAAPGERDIPAERANTTERIHKRMEEGDSIGDISRFVQKIAEQFVAEGVRTRDALIDSVHSVLLEINPEITRRETMDAISGYGSVKLLNMDEVKVQLRDLKGQMQQVGKLEDMQAGHAPSKTGVERRTPSDEERRLIKQVEEAKRRGGYTVTDPATQLKSSLDARKTGMRNQIRDLDFQIASREKIVREKTTPPTDAEFEALRTKRDELKKQFDEIFTTPELTDAQRLERADRTADRQIAELERQLRTNELYQKMAKPLAKTSTEYEAKKARIAALKEEKEYARELVQTSPDPPTEIEVRAKEIDAQISAIENQLKAGEVFPKGKKPLVDYPELNAKMAKLAELKTTRASLRESLQPKPLPLTESELRAKALDAQIAAIEKQLKSGEIFSKEKKPVVDDPALNERIARLAELRTERASLRESIQPRPLPLTDLQRYKAGLSKRYADALETLAKQEAGDFSKPVQRKTTELDSEALTAKAEHERVKHQIRANILNEEMKNRPRWVKGMDVLTKWRRGFILSGATVLGKLTTAAAQRMTFTPLEEIVGAGIGKIVPALSEGARREGGFNAKAEARAFTQAFMKGLPDAWKTLTSTSDLQALYGKGNEVGTGERMNSPAAFIDIFGRIHGALKAPVKRAEFERSFEKRIQWEMEHGSDVTDPIVQTRVGIEAYKDANRAIFLQDNVVTSAYNAALRRLEQKDKITGKPSVAGKALATTGRVLIPIVKVPTNIVAETIQTITGTITGSAKIALAMRNGVEGLEKLHPEAKDQIMRELKKGSLGGAALLIGYYNADKIGGYYQSGENRKESDVKAGAMRILGVDIPKWAVHNPLLMVMQIGASVNRISHAPKSRTDMAEKGIAFASVEVARDLLDEVPFVSQLEETAHLAEFQPNSVNNLVKSLVVPQGIQQLATATDKDSEGNPAKRKADTMMQAIQSGIPGLRQRVPQITPQEIRATSVLKDQSQKSAELTYSATQEINRIMALPIDQREGEFQNLQKTNPEVADRMFGVRENQIKELDALEKKILSMNTNKGVRAKFIYDEIMRLPEDQRAAFEQRINDEKKNIITDEIYNQLKELVEQGKAHPAPKPTSQFIEGKVYRDPENGIRMRYQDGQFVNAA